MEFHASLTMSPITITLILSYVVSSFTLAGSLDAPICYKKHALNEKTTRFTRTVCEEPANAKKSEIEVLKSDFSLSALIVERQIYIGTPSKTTGASGRISFPSQNISDIYFTLKSGQGRFFEVPSGYQKPTRDDSGLLLNTTIVVAADEAVNVYAYQGCAHAYGKQASAFRVKNIKNLGTDYWVLTYFRSYSHLGIVAVKDNTSLSISFNHSDGGSEMNTQDILLNKYDTYYLVLPFDATGTHITSDEKISVVAGVRSIILPKGSKNTEPFCETLEPVSDWGKSFSTVHFLGPQKGNDYIIKFISAENNNTVNWKQGAYQNSTILQQGESQTLLVPANYTNVLEINASKDILLAQFATKGNPPITNPAMTLIPPHENGTEEEIVFPVFDLTYKQNATNYLTVWMPASAKRSDLSLDGMRYVNWREFAEDGSGWKILQTALKEGSHVLMINKGLKVRAIVFAAEHLRSVAYPVV
ncbi:hypothetical protein HOLleu_15767 [Holothuria leucospilota]|uniref:IgGFc-binding protein N-terminal domain-containing protein n=1 Tax=Holothuria leucospilota TaxID=206669 RepID=A0A9Q1HAE6_HOLLE|nr:hypothetical protein HOLleu_15767 [Holothuria leucospilota]